MNLQPASPSCPLKESAYTLPEVIVAVAIMALMIISLYAGFSSGFSMVQLSRENLRATQILVQRMETLRLFKWSQLTNAGYLPQNFTEYYDSQVAADESRGVVYSGRVTLTVPGDLPAAYQNNMRAVDVTLYWTNVVGNRSVVRTRSVQTYVSRYGMQNYAFANP